MSQDLYAVKRHKCRIDIESKLRKHQASIKNSVNQLLSTVKGNLMLPEDIEEHLLSYLHLEFGEDPKDEKSLKISELKYLGEFLFEDVPTHFWEYPCMGSVSWAIVQPFEDSYCLNMSVQSPEQFENI